MRVASSPSVALALARTRLALARLSSRLSDGMQQVNRSALMLTLHHTFTQLLLCQVSACQTRVVHTPSDWSIYVILNNRIMDRTV
jgi:hypothetical protein